MGDGIDENFSCAILNLEDNHTLASCRDGTAPRRNLIAQVALVRNLGKTKDHSFDLRQLCCSGRCARVIRYPSGDLLKIVHHQRVEAYTIAQR